MRAALQFLTIVPIPAPATPIGRSAPWFPIVGACIGVVVAAAWYTPVQATLAIVIAIVLTGGLHEDGLADVCDAIRAGRSRERMFEILKDSRVGAYGAIAICLSILVRWQAMSHCTGNIWLKFAAAFGLSRASMVLLAATTPAAAPGLGDQFCSTLPRGTLWWIAAQSIVLALLDRSYTGAFALLSVLMATLCVRVWLMRRLGGITGDCLGFQCQIAESIALGVFAWS